MCISSCRGSKRYDGSIPSKSEGFDGVGSVCGLNYEDKKVVEVLNVFRSYNRKGCVGRQLKLSFQEG